MIVVDTNVLIALFLRTDVSGIAEAVLERDSDFRAPALWRSEFCNALGALSREGQLSVDDAIAAIGAADEFMADRAYEPDAGEVMMAAAHTGCATYDAEFVVTARQLGVPLISFDRLLLQRFPGIVVSPSEFAGMHH